MFENLIESKPKKTRTFKQSVFSLILHVVLGYAAIRATAGAAETMKAILQDTTMVFLKAPEPPPPPPPEAIPPEALVSANPPPLGFQTVMPPTEIPKEIPPVNLNERFNAADFSGKGVEGGISTGAVGGTGPVTGETFLEAQVDDPVAPITQPKPRYPPVLQQAGVAGRVEVQYVVDTLGHAEPASWKVLKSSHKLFEEPAREAVMKSVFKPARIKGQAVRQLVQQAMVFNMNQ
ncbi:MAG TPA: energy transducer TonB [Gemmatimonadales bacterium]|jgi:protein TonB|nr:energy transducer TonB [Gemmatimonadales bacterium]